MVDGFDSANVRTPHGFRWADGSPAFEGSLNGAGGTEECLLASGAEIPCLPANSPVFAKILSIFSHSIAKTGVSDIVECHFENLGIHLTRDTTQRLAPNTNSERKVAEILEESLGRPPRAIPRVTRWAMDGSYQQQGVTQTEFTLAGTLSSGRDT